jgi:hypothetical protein
MTDARAFRGFRFPAEVILWAARWYLQFPISYRDLEAMLADRGVEVDHVTLYRWVQRFAPELEKRTGSVALAGHRHAGGPSCPGQAARPKSWWTKVRCAGMSSLGAARTCPLASIASASTPASARRAVTNRLNPSIGRVRRLMRRWSCSMA